MSPVRLPILSLQKLKLTKRNIKLVSLLDEKYTHLRFQVIAIGNWDLGALDVKKMLAATEGLTIIVSTSRDGRFYVSELTSCPHFKETGIASKWGDWDFMGPHEVCPCEELYNESEFSLDDDDYGDSMDDYY